MPVLPAPKGAIPEWCVDTSGYRNTGEFMDSAKDFCAGAFGDVFSHALEKVPAKDRLKYGVRLMGSSPLSRQFLYDSADSAFAGGYNEGVKAFLPIFEKLLGPDVNPADHTEEDLLIEALGKIRRDRRRAAAIAMGDIPEPPTPEPEPQVEEHTHAGSRPSSPHMC
ncbi:unnamed protein product [Cuscuta epithymum]|uniref:Uncharacterized protein n=1 Tax=Cuscuta epithymum TaxID=186058 RepID=A0AAV0F2Y5_9ASTE|nr:unnamed protein product [Cuscuta epithymum]